MRTYRVGENLAEHGIPPWGFELVWPAVEEDAVEAACVVHHDGGFFAGVILEEDEEHDRYD